MTTVSKRIYNWMEANDYGYLLKGVDKIQIKFKDGKYYGVCPDKRCPKPDKALKRIGGVGGLDKFGLISHLKLTHKTGQQIKEEEEKKREKEKREKKKRGKKKN
jgi:hypothetical protein